MSKKQRCECCGKEVEPGQIAARVWNTWRNISMIWCFTCWDNDEQAVEQYRTAESNL